MPNAKNRKLEKMKKILKLENKEQVKLENFDEKNIIEIFQKPSAKIKLKFDEFLELPDSMDDSDAGENG